MKVVSKYMRSAWSPEYFFLFREQAVVNITTENVEF